MNLDWEWMSAYLYKHGPQHDLDLDEIDMIQSIKFSRRKRRIEDIAYDYGSSSEGNSEGIKDDM